MRTRIKRLQKVNYSQESKMHEAIHGPVLELDNSKIRKKPKMTLNQLCNFSSFIKVDDNNQLTFVLNIMDIYECIKAHIKHVNDYAKLTGTKPVHPDEDYTISRFNFALQVFLNRYTCITESDVDRVKRFAKAMRYTYRTLTREDAAQRAQIARKRQDDRIGWSEISKRVIKKKTSTNEAFMLMAV